MNKWVLRILSLAIIIFLAAVIYIEVNKEKLVASAVASINENIYAEVSYKDVSISILKSFPSLRIGLDSLTIVSDHERGDSRLYSSHRTSADLDLISIIKNEIKINSIILDGSKINLQVFEDGSNNYSIIPATNTSSDKSSDFRINQLRIKESQLYFKDKGLSRDIKLNDIDLTGTLKYQNELIQLSSDASGDLFINVGNYLPNYNSDIEISANLELTQNLDSIRWISGLIRVNDLPVEFDGLITDIDGYYDYDFSFSSPKTSFKNLISALPIYYQNQYQKLISEGSYTLSGSIRGANNRKYPAYDISMSAANGMVAYPNLPNKLKNVKFQLNAKNSNYDKLYEVIKIENLNVEMGSSFVRGNISAIPQDKLEKISYNLTTDIDLNDIENSIMSSSISNLEGLISGKIIGNSLVASNSIVEQNLESDIKLEKILFEQDNKVFILDAGQIAGSKNKIDFDIKGVNYLDAIDLDLSGQINNIIHNILIEDSEISGNMSINAGKIDLNKVRELSSSDATERYTIPKTSLAFDFNADKILHSNHVLNGVESQGIVSDRSTNFKFIVNEFNGSRMKGDGNLSNVLQYGINSDTLKGKLEIDSDILNLDAFMAIDNRESSNISNTELIPDNINLDIEYVSDNIKFKNINILKSLGVLSIKDNKIISRNDGNIFGGQIRFKGSLDTNLPEGYEIDLNLELKELSFQESASKTKIFSDIIPIANFINGKYTASLNWKSKLNNNYIPDLRTISAIGTIETKDGVISGTLPLDSFINKFTTIKDRGDIKLMDTKNYFVIEDGGIVIDQLNFVKNDINISMSGSHGFDQSLNYQLIIEIPGKKIKADQLLEFIKDKINFSNRLKSATGNLNLQLIVHMGGSIIKPAFKVQKVNLKSGSVVENITETAELTIKSGIDTIRNKIRDTIKTTVNVITDIIGKTKGNVQTKLEGAKTSIEGNVDSTIVSLEQIISGQGGGLKKEGQTLIDSIKTGNVDSIRKRIQTLFKNKKGAIDSLKISKPKGRIKLLERINN